FRDQNGIYGLDSNINNLKRAYIFILFSKVNGQSFNEFSETRQTILLEDLTNLGVWQPNCVGEGMIWHVI
ncbi:hypothetical protein ACJX0J_038806, partial [Zea mays]